MKDRKTEFLEALAEYLVDGQVAQSISLQMGKPAAILWSKVRSTTPLFGYPTHDEAVQQLGEWLGIAPAAPIGGIVKAHTESKVSVSVEDRAKRILASKYLGSVPPPWMTRLALLTDDAREVAAYVLTAQSTLAERDAEIAELREVLGPKFPCGKWLIQHSEGCAIVDRKPVLAWWHGTPRRDIFGHDPAMCITSAELLANHPDIASELGLTPKENTNV